MRSIRFPSHRPVVCLGLLAVMGWPAVATAQVPAPVTLSPPNPTAVELHGSTVAPIADINGDGKPDIIVGSYFGSGNVGRVYIYSGATGQRIRQLGQPIVEVDGFFGYSLSGVSDVNGDGVPDVIVGAPNDSPGSSPAQCGRVYLYSGATGGFLRTLVPPRAEAFGNFGESVAGIQDLNGDGRGDVVVGFPHEDRMSSSGSNSDSGRVVIYSGATGQIIRNILPIAPEDSGDFGKAVAVAPDMNGDGIQDVIVGAPKERPDDAGRVYIYSGATGAFLRKLLPPTPQNDGRFGEAVASVPDATGDGIPEVIVGAPREFGRAGRAYIFNGATGVLIRTLVSPGNEADGRFGTSVAGVPDLNNDGRGDAIVGASHEDPGTSPNNNGRAYIYSGTGAFLFKLIPPNGNSSEEFGYSVCGLGDTNNNGRGEVVVGAPGDDNGSNNGDGNAFHYRF
ncbi:MAG: FG-GAP repeat protein [Phycisphaerae bacterium]|nr:FG-GAP repeat protein [Phycisphaerae bacterium]